MFGIILRLCIEVITSRNNNTDYNGLKLDIDVPVIAEVKWQLLSPKFNIQPNLVTQEANTNNWEEVKELASLRFMR